MTPVTSSMDDPVARWQKAVSHRRYGGREFVDVVFKLVRKKRRIDSKIRQLSGDFPDFVFNAFFDVVQLFGDITRVVGHEVTAEAAKNILSFGHLASEGVDGHFCVLDDWNKVH